MAVSDEEKKEECEPTPRLTTEAVAPNEKTVASLTAASNANVADSTLKKQQHKDDRKTDPIEKSEPTLSSLQKSSPSPKPAQKTQQTSLSRRGFIVSSLRSMLRITLVDIPLAVLFALLVAATLLHHLHDEYFYPQIQLMQFQSAGRDYTDTTYYHRVCEASDVSAKSVDELIIPPHYSTKDATEHMLRHGASVYPNLITNDTAFALREWIDRENKVQEGWFVIKNEHRYSWGIDMNMHPMLLTFWKELIAHPQLLDALQSIVGPDPAIIEFTAITSSYGAVDQHDHADVVPPGSAAKFARTFIPSYSLFVPLQDTTYEMGATHVCPGTHLCSDGCAEFCPRGNNIALSGPKGEGGVWPRGWGALVNQQTTHKGMGYTQKGGIDRVVLIATFAPRPQTTRTIETRMIGQGGSYSQIWHQWGHTLYDFVHADKRMTEPQKTLRSLGLIKAKGWNWPTVTSIRVANEDTGYTDDTLGDFIENQGFSFLPKSWQAGMEVDQEEEVSNGDLTAWNAFLYETVKTSENELKKINLGLCASYLVALFLLDLFLWLRKMSRGSMLLRGIGRIVLTHGSIALAAWMALHHIDETHWAKAIKAKKAFRIPVMQLDQANLLDLPPSTIPYKTDILLAPHYVSELLGSYGKVVDFAHPGNRYWKDMISEYATGYAALTQELQFEFCDSLVEWMESDRRFLKQDRFGYWTKVIADDELQRFCDKELRMSADPLSEVMLRALGELESETKFGRWRGMAIYNRTSSSYIEHIEALFFPKGKDQGNSRSRRPVKSLTIRRFLREVPETTTFQRRFSLPATPKPKEPVPGAWLQEGDMVEVKDKCWRNVWYPARINSAIPNSAKFGVENISGEKGPQVIPRCLRRFEPYKPGDHVEVRIGKTDKYRRGEIISVQNEGFGSLLDIETEQGVLKMVAPSRIRRLENSSEAPVEIGSRVMARFNGGLQSYPGTVDAVHDDDTVAVLYDDGDYEERLPVEFVELADV